MSSVVNESELRISQQIKFDEKDKEAFERVMEIVNLILYPDFEIPCIDEYLDYKVMVRLHRDPWVFSTEQPPLKGQSISPDRLGECYDFKPDDLKTLRDLLIILYSSDLVHLYSHFENDEL